MPERDRNYAVFICHASEDKEAVARPLAELLQRRGYQVWFDEFELTPGDSLRREIGRGLRESSLGVVILSPRFFEKEWAQRELDALTALEVVDGQKRIVPVWHELSRKDVLSKAPDLADRLAMSSEKGVARVADQVESMLHAIGLGLLDADSPVCPLCFGAVPWPCRECGGGGKCRECGDKGWNTCWTCKGGGQIEDTLITGNSRNSTCWNCDGKGVGECFCEGHGCISCKSTGENSEDCPICGSRIPFLPTREVPCNYCLGDGEIRCDCYSGECKDCEGKRENDCATCNGTGRCAKCKGAEMMRCTACRGTGRGDPRVLWWNRFDKNTKSGNVDDLVHDYQTSLPLIPAKFRSAATDYMESYLRRMGFPNTTLKKLIAFSRQLP